MTTSYKTDYIWVTVSAPKGVWDQDMDAELKSALSGYTSGDASKCITLTQLESDDPWTIRFMIIAAKAKAEHLASFKEMNSQYKGSSLSEKLLSHSLLLEHGIHVTKGNKFISNASK